MRLLSSAFAALLCVSTFGPPANAYEIELTREPAPYFLSAPHRLQGGAIRRQVVNFASGYAPGTVVVSTQQRRLI
jgi:hypothetical protein